MISLILTIAVAALVGYFVYLFVRGFRDATGTLWERLLGAAKGSASILWAYVLGAAGAILAFAAKVAMFVNLPEVAQFIQVSVPVEYVGGALIAIAVINVLSRLRTLVWN